MSGRTMICTSVARSRDDVQHLGARQHDRAERTAIRAAGTLIADARVERARAGGEQHERHRPEDERLAPEIRDADALEHDPARDQHEPLRRHDVASPTAAPRHAFDRKDEPESICVGSIVAASSAPSIATRCDDVRAETRIPNESATRMNSVPSASSSVETALHRDAETPRAPPASTVSTLMNPMHEVRRDLADDDLPRAQRRHEQRFHRARFLLARQRERRHERGDDHEHHRHQPGHEEIRARARRVESRSRLRHDLDHPRAAGLLGLVALDDGVDVELSRGSRIRLGCVGRDEDARRLSRRQTLGRTRVRTRRRPAPCRS